jgi:hypothetical protein
MTPLALKQQMARFTTQERDDLFVKVLAHDDIYDDPQLPGLIPMADDSAELFDCFIIVAKLFTELSSIELARAFMALLVQSPDQAAAALSDLKHPRARFKHMQFTYNLCDARHRYPRFLHAVTVIMGEVQDALRYGDTTRAKRLGRWAKMMLGPMGQARMDSEIRGFRVSSLADYHNHIARQMAVVDDFLAKDRVTAHQLHVARKAISRLMAHYDNLSQLKPNADRMATARFISTLNGLMGGYHDVLVKQKQDGTLDYKNDIIPVPGEQTQMLRQLSSCFRIALANKLGTHSG